jgi:peptide/nickel transport system substrate-binding protein
MKVARNSDYWKPGRPYLDGIEYTIIPNRSTAVLSFIAGKFDMTFPYEVTLPLMRDIKSQMPEAVCDFASENVAANIVMNYAPPFDNVEIRKAVVMAMDRQAYIDILAEGQAQTGGAMMPAPDGAWGLPADKVRDLPGFDPDIAKSRAAAREIMKAHGYGPDKHLTFKLSTRNLPSYRDASVILLGQLKEIWMDGELEPIETAIWVPKLIRREYQMGLSLVGNGVDDPDQQFYENYVCGSRTYMGYCDKALDALVDQQSAEPDQKKRQEIVWQIDRKLQQNAVRPMLYYLRGATCRRPEVKGVTVMVNSIFNGWRMEDVWLDR